MDISVVPSVLELVFFKLAWLSVPGTCLCVDINTVIQIKTPFSQDYRR